MNYLVLEVPATGLEHATNVDAAYLLAALNISARSRAAWHTEPLLFPFTLTDRGYGATSCQPILASPLAPRLFWKAVFTDRGCEFCPRSRSRTEH